MVAPAVTQRVQGSGIKAARVYNGVRGEYQDRQDPQTRRLRVRVINCNLNPDDEYTSRRGCSRWRRRSQGSDGRNHSPCTTTNATGKPRQRPASRCGITPDVLVRYRKPLAGVIRLTWLAFRAPRFLFRKGRGCAQPQGGGGWKRWRMFRWKQT